MSDVAILFLSIAGTAFGIVLVGRGLTLRSDDPLRWPAAITGAAIIALSLWFGYDALKEVLDGITDAINTPLS